MSFRITSLWFEARRRSPRREATLPPALEWDGVAHPDGIVGRPGDLPVPVGQQLRRWGALLALAGLALPGVSARREPNSTPPAVAMVDVSRVEARGPEVSRDGTGPGEGTGGDVPVGDTEGGTAPAGPGEAGPWQAGMLEADGKPLPSAPPPGPVPVTGIPAPAVAPTTTTSAGNRTPGDGLVPPQREYLRPILIRYAQENGLPADLVMALAWVESSWRRTAVSEAGAVGVLQLMPNTVEYVSKDLLGLRTNLDPRNATSNVRMGTKYLRYLLDRSGGNLRQALIAYNQGLTSLRTRGSYPAAEAHADRVLSLRPQFRSA